MYLKLWSTVATLKQLLPLGDEIGNCWMELGLALDLSEARVFNIEVDYNCNIQRGYAVLRKWKEQHGKNATMGRLAVALVGIGKTNIVHKLYGMCSS